MLRAAGCVLHRSSVLDRATAHLTSRNVLWGTMGEQHLWPKGLGCTPQCTSASEKPWAFCTTWR